MEIVNLDRRRGKTYFLVKRSAIMEYPILCYNKDQVEHIKNVAIELKLKIPEPIVVRKSNLDIVFRGHKFKQKYLIDDVDVFLSSLLGESIECVTTSCEVLSRKDLGISMIFDGTTVNDYSMENKGCTMMFKSEDDE
ncbi:MAG: hypothetical protein ACLR4X_04870 [Clostridia bacterium]